MYCSSSTPLSSRYCGHRQLIPIILNTTNNLVEMEFRSDATQTARGLFGFFRVVPTYLTGDSGIGYKGDSFEREGGGGEGGWEGESESIL